MKPEATFDTSFWINAHRVGLVPHVLRSFTLRYTAAVAGELRDRYPPGQEFWRLVNAGALEEVVPAAMRIREFGDGERAAISAIMEHPTWTLLMDDYRPYQMAVRMGMRVLCTPAVVINLFNERELNAIEARAVLEHLTRLKRLAPVLLLDANAWLDHAHALGDGQG